MRSIIVTFVLAPLAVVALDGAALAQAASPQQRAEHDPFRANTASGKLLLGMGDKLKITFYETIDLAGTKQGGRSGTEPEGTLRTFYQRMDLSGDYTIEQDGAISIPLLGRFQVEGRPIEEVQTNLAASFTSVMGRSANISVKIADRSPVYVVGPVKSPGAYKYVPGMLVLHAIALAGGIDRGVGQLSGMIEGAREMERLQNASFQVKRLLARRARLEAEHDGNAAVPMPIQLAKLAGEDDAHAFLAVESAILRADQARRQQQEKEIAVKIAAARNEVDALKQKLDQIDVQKEMRLERLNDMQKLKERGLNTSNNVITLRTELSDIEAHRQDYLVAVVQAQARLAEAEEANARLATENRANLAKDMATVDQEIAAAQETMISAGMMATILYSPANLASRAQTYEIVRQTKDGARTFQAEETSPLMPGDVLKISASSMIPVPVPIPRSKPMAMRIRVENTD